MEQNSDINSNLISNGMEFESLEKLRNLPMVESALQQGGNVYGMVKDHNQYFQWALGTAEGMVQRAVTLSAPLVQTFDKPIKFVDQKLVQGIETLELNAPIIKETPQEVYNQTKNKIVQTVQSKFPRVLEVKEATGQKAASLKELSWKKTNELLTTQYGSMAVTGLDTTVSLAERLIDYFFPDEEIEAVDEKDVPVSAQEDPTLHTVQTIGMLSHLATRRMYRNMIKHMRMIDTKNMKEYTAMLIAVLHLTKIANALNHNIFFDAGQIIRDTGKFVSDVVRGGGQVTANTIKTVDDTPSGRAVSGIVVNESEIIASTTAYVTDKISTNIENTGVMINDIMSGGSQAKAIIDSQMGSIKSVEECGHNVVHNIVAGEFGQNVTNLVVSNPEHTEKSVSGAKPIGNSLKNVSNVVSATSIKTLVESEKGKLF